MKRCIVLIMLISIPLGCSTVPKRNFTGQPYPTSFATVFTASSIKSSKARIFEVNGKRTANDFISYPSVIDIPLGNNTIMLWAESPVNNGSYVGSVSFSAIDGRMYCVTLDSMPQSEAINPLTPDSLKNKKPLPQPVRIADKSFTDIASLLDFWGILSIHSDISAAFTSDKSIKEVNQAVEQHVQSLPYAQANMIISETKDFLDSAWRELNERKKYQPIGFIVRDTMDGSLVASVGTQFKKHLPTPPPAPYVYIPPPVTYTPPPKPYVPPKINFTPPPSFR